MMAVFAVILSLSSPSSAKAQKQLVTTWATAHQLVEPNNMPPAPYLDNNSLRQIVQVSIGGERIRLRLTNAFSKESTEILGVEIAAAKTAGSSYETDEKTTTSVLFGGKKNVTMEADGEAVSDIVKFHLEPRQNVAITIHYGKTDSKSVSGHPGSRTTSYIKAGNTTDFADAVRTDHWYNIRAIDVVSKPSRKSLDNPRAIAVLGNSITDGRGSTTNGQDRWCDNLSRALLAHEGTHNVSVLNFGIGGNCVLRGGLGPTGQKRYTDDLFGQEGVKYIILFEGVNDLGGSRDAVKTANEIIEVYKKIAKEAHEKGIIVYGGTITPFMGSFYENADREKGRQTLNTWIRETRDIDGVIDFDKVMSDPANPDKLNPLYLFENDYLHPNAQGYKKMIEAINLDFFSEAYLKQKYTLPDPFLGNDGRRHTKLSGWNDRRMEIIRDLEKYEIGTVPPMDGMKLTAKLDNKQLIVTVTAPNGESIDVKAYIQYPDNITGPCPALLSISNCLPPKLFTDRGCAIIHFDFNTVCKHQQTRGQEPINKLYPDLITNGAYSYWPWGISRIIDALEQLGPEVTKIDTRHLAISGCSWAGKAALWSGAMDERICLVIPQESGGGGIAAWRVSETLGKVETIGRTDGHWFLESMIKTYGNGNIGHLPLDHHFLAALVAPRALLFFGNNDYEWLADESGYVSMKAAQEIYSTLGVPDHVGFAIEGGHGHCQLPEQEYEHVIAYIERFLLEKEGIKTDIEIAPAFDGSVNWKKWMW